MLALLERYGKSSRRFQRFALKVLSASKLPESEHALVKLLDVEEEPAYRGRIFDGLRFRFSPTATALLRRELDERTSSMFPKEIRKALYVIDCVLGVVDRSASSYRAELDARGVAERLGDAWDGVWFEEDYCEGPGQALIVTLASSDTSEATLPASVRAVVRVEAVAIWSFS